jgi:hypothetical protein
MDRIDELSNIVQREVADYNNVRDWKAKGYYLEDPQEQVYTIVIVPDPDHPDWPTPSIMMMARVIEDKVIIDEDTTDRPLYEQLVSCGIPRDQIILAYAGEKPPTAENS